MINQLKILSSADSFSRVHADDICQSAASMVVYNQAINPKTCGLFRHDWSSVELVPKSSNSCQHQFRKPLNKAQHCPPPQYTHTTADSTLGTSTATKVFSIDSARWSHGQQSTWSILKNHPLYSNYIPQLRCNTDLRQSSISKTTEATSRGTQKPLCFTRPALRRLVSYFHLCNDFHLTENKCIN